MWTLETDVETNSNLKPQLTPPSVSFSAERSISVSRDFSMFNIISASSDAKIPEEFIINTNKIYTNGKDIIDISRVLGVKRGMEIIYLIC